MNIEHGLPLNPLDEPVEIRVARGMALLDEKVPDWRTRVNLDILDMASDNDCVLGQLFGRYIAGWEPLGLTSTVHTTRYGFNVVPNEYSDPNDALSAELTRTWRAALAPTPAQ